VTGSHHKHAVVLEHFPLEDEHKRAEDVHHPAVAALKFAVDHLHHRLRAKPSVCCEPTTRCGKPTAQVAKM
jgi:hypothetical protein